MSMALSSFIIEASQNPTLLHQFREMPEVIGGRAGLTSQEREVVLSGDEARLFEALNDEPVLLPILVREYVFRQ